MTFPSCNLEGLTSTEDFGWSFAIYEHDGSYECYVVTRRVTWKKPLGGSKYYEMQDFSLLLHHNSPPQSIRVGGARARRGPERCPYRVRPSSGAGSDDICRRGGAAGRGAARGDRGAEGGGGDAAIDEQQAVIGQLKVAAVGQLAVIGELKAAAVVQQVAAAAEQQAVMRELKAAAEKARAAAEKALATVEEATARVRVKEMQLVRTQQKCAPLETEREDLERERRAVRDERDMAQLVEAAQSSDTGAASSAAPTRRAAPECGAAEESKAAKRPRTDTVFEPKRSAAALRNVNAYVYGLERLRWQQSQDDVTIKMNRRSGETVFAAYIFYSTGNDVLMAGYAGFCPIFPPNAEDAVQTKTWSMQLKFFI
ncbi:hypothetical protein GGX14DRAFT_398921 [Mycena pura]|uniref:Uncharacterized protein n=1 Tax=Mycena pura TaxID=153505 RepID=A0AAD6V5X1_9AGAR|nr:hypothetical protein GGX14DRAFT_398921 [Mycena pura]